MWRQRCRRVGHRVHDFLVGLFVPAFDLFARFLGIQNIPSAIGKGLRAVKDAAQRPIKAILAAIGTSFKAAINSLLANTKAQQQRPCCEP